VQGCGYLTNMSDVALFAVTLEGAPSVRTSVLPRLPRRVAALAVIGLVSAPCGCALDYGAFSVQSTGGQDTTGGAGTGATGGGGAGSATGGSATGGGATGGSTTGGGANGGGATGGSATGGSGVGGSGAGGQGQGGAGGAGPCVVTYQAVVSDCVEPSDPDPDLCRSQLGVGHMLVDTSYTSTDSLPRNIYLRFDIDTPPPTNIASAEVQLVTSNHALNGAASTGELWQVQPFSRADLFIGIPTIVGAVPVGNDKGSTGSDSPVTWAAPTAPIQQGASLYFGVLPLSNDGLVYWTIEGAEPPRLVVSCM